jgi:hypothetical protein
MRRAYRSMTKLLEVASSRSADCWGRRVERIGLVTYRAGDEIHFAAMANAGPARPAHWHVARLCQVEQVLEPRSPANGKTRARE